MDELYNYLTNSALIQGHGDATFASMTFDSYLTELGNGTLPNVLPTEISNFFEKR